MIDTIARALRSHRFRCDSEADLQEGISRVLTEAGLPHRREHHLGPDRVDFFLAGIALEVKIDGSLSAVTRQLHRYAQHPDVHSVLLVTTRALHDRMPVAMCGKPVAVIHLEGGAF
jgi:hypothetical protein